MVDEVCINEALFSGAKEVFETMVFMDVAKPADLDQRVEGDTLLGSITFGGDIEGCLAICCSVACAKTIAANMLGTEPTDEISQEEICDAFGEVINMVMGSVKARLQDSIANVVVSIPTVVSGRGLQNSLGERACKVLIQATFDDEYLAEISLLYRERRVRENNES